MQEAVNLAELIFSALGILSIVIASWMYVRVELAKMGQRMINLEKDMMREQQQNSRRDERLWGVLAKMQEDIGAMRVQMEQKQDKT